MPFVGTRLKVACLIFGFLMLTAQAGTRTPEAIRAALPPLAGQERLVALLELANSLEAKAPQEGLVYAKEGLALASQAGDKEMEAAFLSTSAYCCSQLGDFPMAIEYGKKALTLSTELGNRERMAKAHNSLGITYTFIGSYSQALEESFEALRIREELGLDTPVSQSLNLIGVVYHHSGQYEKAIEYFNQILKRVEAKPDLKRLILAKLNIGFALYKLGRLPEALHQHQEALALSLSSGESTYVNYAYLNLGLTYSDLKQFQKAGHYLRLARAEYEKQDQKHGVVQVLNASARLNLLSGTAARGIPLAKAAAELAQKINAKDELRQSYEFLSQIHENLGQVAESYRYYKLATTINDSLHTLQETNKISEISMKIVTLKKDNEIESLKKEKLISALNIEKQRYLSVVFLSSIGFLVAIVVILGNYNKKMRQSRKSLEGTNADLARLNEELRDKMNEINTLSGLLPICAQCKKIRNDKGYWTQLEGYISERTSATFSHGICPHCAEDLFPGTAERIRAKALSGPSEAT